MSRTRALTRVLAVCIVVLFVYLGVDLVKQQRQHKLLNQRTADAFSALAVLRKPAPDLQERLENARLLNENARQSILPAETNTTEAVDAVLRAADANSVKALPLSTSPWSESNAGGKTYMVFRLSLNIEGTLTDLVGFLRQVEAGFASMVVDNLAVTVSGTDQSTGVSGTCDLVLYTLAGQ